MGFHVYRGMYWFCESIVSLSESDIYFNRLRHGLLTWAYIPYRVSVDFSPHGGFFWARGDPSKRRVAGVVRTFGIV